MTQIEHLPTDRLVNHPANDPARSEIDVCRDLIESIEEFGQMEPGRVRRVGVHNYQILSGHRRATACRYLGRDFAAIVVKESDTDATRDLVLGNIRRDLDPIARARLVKTAIDGGIDREEVARMFSMSDSHLADTLRLLDLPASIADLLSDGILPLREARHFVPFAAAPLACDRLAAEIRKNEHMHRGWKPHTVAEAIKRLTRPCDRKTRYELNIATGPQPRRFEIDADTEERLDIVTLPVGIGRRKIPTAQNCVLWDRLQKRALKTLSTSDASDDDTPPAQPAPLHDAETDASADRDLAIATERFWVELRRAAIAHYVIEFGSPIAAELGPILLTHLRGTRWLDIVAEIITEPGDYNDDNRLLAHARLAVEWGDSIFAHAFALITWPSGDLDIDGNTLPGGRPRSMPLSEPVHDPLWDLIAFRLGLDVHETWAAAATQAPARSVLAHWLRIHTADHRSRLATHLGLPADISVEKLLTLHSDTDPLPLPPITK